MELKRYNDAESFFNKVETYLRKSEVENNIMLGVCTNLKNKKDLNKGNYFGVVEENGEIKLTVQEDLPLVQQWTYEMSAAIGEHSSKEYFLSLQRKRLRMSISLFRKEFIYG